MDNTSTRRDNLSSAILPVATHGQGTSEGCGRICSAGCDRGCVNGCYSGYGRRHNSEVSQTILLPKMLM